MKKNLRNSLILALGLITTGVFAQDWSGDSRTRINMHGENDMMSTDQRATLGVTWGDSDWGIHVSGVVNYTLGENDETTPASIDVYEAYGTTSLFGFANMTAGRQALEYGSGTIIGKNDWNPVRQTWDGMKFSVNNDLANVDIGWFRENAPEEDADTVMQENSNNALFANLSKSGDNWNMNLFYMDNSAIDGGEAGDKSNAMGLDLNYTMSGFDLGLSYNTASTTAAGETPTDMDVMTISAGYAVNDNLSLGLSRTAYGESGFASGVGNLGGYLGHANDTLVDDTTGLQINQVSTSANADGSDNNWLTHGNMGHLAAEDVAMSVDVDYTMGAVSLSVGWTTVSSGMEAPEDTQRDGVDWDEWDRTVVDFGLGYSLNDNASLSLRYVTDAIAEGDADKYMWVGLQITP
ncbi:MAG: alginate export family protein [Bacteroidota bacterium]|nr:alginate export family protein [Bacteroidota bacterium]